MFNSKKYFLLALVGIALGFSAFAQVTRPMKERKTRMTLAWKDSLYYGANISLQMDNSGSLIDLSPNVGYKFNKFLSVGVQGIFTNISYRYSSSYTYKSTFYGAGVFVRFKPLPFLFLQAEYDILNVPDNFSIAKPKRTIADVNLAGVGLRNEFAENVCYCVLLMYEFVPTPNSPYTHGPFGSPLVYRAGFTINF